VTVGRVSLALLIMLKT